MAGGNGGNGTGGNLNLGGAGGAFGRPGGSTSKTSSGGAGGGGAGAVGGRASGTGGVPGTSGTARHPGGSAGRSGKVGTAGVGGGGGGNGILFKAGGVLTTKASFGGGSGGAGGAGTPGRNGRAGGGGGEGGYGIAATGASPTMVDIEAGTVLVTGGRGGRGGASPFGTGGGNGGAGGVGVYLPTSGSSLDLSSGKISGGDGGVGGIGSTGDGSAGAGGAGVLGANITVINSGTIAGGRSGALLGPQADAIDFTGGTNALTLGSGGKQGTITGDIGVTGSLAIDSATTATTSATLSSVIHNTADGAGSISAGGAGTLTLSAQSTYSGGTTLNGGTLELDGATQSVTDVGPGRDTITYGAAGTGSIAFGTAGPATLQVDDIALTNPGGNTSYLAYAITGFVAGDTIDLDNLGASGATVSYKGDVLTVTANGTSDELDINAAPSGYRYTTVTDASGAGIDVVLTAVKARRSTGAQADAATLAVPIAPFSDRTSAGSGAPTGVGGAGGAATDLFGLNGSQEADVSTGGRTFASSVFDTVQNGGASPSTFVFDPGFGQDVVSLFRTGGANHDTLSFKGSDFGNDIATVLHDAHNAQGGVVITDPTSHDTVKLTGITKQLLTANQGDIAFHA